MLFLLDLCQTCMQCKYNRDVPLDFFFFLKIQNAFGCDTGIAERTDRRGLLYAGFEDCAVLIQLVELL